MDKFEKLLFYFSYGDGRISDAKGLWKQRFSETFDTFWKSGDDTDPGKHQVKI